ncbi:MAG: protein kinase [Steroidobacterales bacterium]
MSVPAELSEVGVGEVDDALLSLVSAMLSGRYKEDLYLWHVSELCRDEPESAPELLGLIDRYYRLGRMPAEQYQKVKAKIEQAMGTRPPADEPERETARDRETAGDDDDSEESVTRELTPARAPMANSTANQTSRPAKTPAAEPAGTGAPARPRAVDAARRPTPAPQRQPQQQPHPPVAAAASADAAAAAEVKHLSIGVGTVLRERYELLQLLGRGGMASVFKARDRYRTSLGVADCFVAIKIVQPHPSRPGGVAALGREFHNAQRLSHPNVINVYDIDREGDASFYSMEFLEGERLSQLLKRAGDRLARRYALTIIRDIGAAIAHAHSRGVVHSDLKPHNIMITRDGHVRVLDFGSGVVRPGEPWISELSPGGDYRQATPAYASCEQLQGWCADPRDDIYALACLAYQLLAGRHPFDQRSSLVARGRRLRPRRPVAMRGDNWRALRRGLAWSREQRNMTMEKWLEQLGVAEGAEALPPLARLTAAPPPRQWPQRVAAAAAVLLSLGLAAFAIDRQAGVDWPQTLAGVGRSWERLWQQLQPAADSSSPATTAAVPGAMTPSPRLPAAPATLPATPPVLPPSAVMPRVRSARLANVSAAPVLATNATSTSASTGVSAAESNALTDDAGPPRIGFASFSYEVVAGEPAARIVVRRLGSTAGNVSFIWWTEGASAQPDVDYAALGKRVERMPSGTDKVTVYVPIISNPQRTRPSQFFVALGDASAAGGTPPSDRAIVTIAPTYDR